MATTYTLRTDSKNVPTIANIVRNMLRTCGFRADREHTPTKWKARSRKLEAEQEAKSKKPGAESKEQEAKGCKKKAESVGPERKESHQSKRKATRKNRKQSGMSSNLENASPVLMGVLQD